MDLPDARAFETQRRPSVASLSPIVNGKRPVHRGLVVGAAVSATLAMCVGIGWLTSRAASYNAPVPSLSVGAHATSGPSGVMQSRVPITPQIAVQTLVDILPASGNVSDFAGESLDGQVAGQLVFDDGHGRAEIDLSITLPSGGVTGTCQSLPTSPCTRYGRLWTVQTTVGREFPNNGNRYNAATVHARGFRSDGLVIEVTEWNAPTEKDSAPSRDLPPFSLSQMESIVTSPKWSDTATMSAVRDANHLFVPTSPPGMPVHNR